MRFFSHSFKTKAKKIASVFLVTFVIFFSSFSVLPKQADAQFAVVETGINLIKNTITSVASGITSQATTALQLKEFTLDGIATSLAKKVLSQMVRSTIDWVNSGFNGSPAFITDLDQYLLNAADEIAGNFLVAANFSQLCRPLQLPVRFILDLSYQKARNWQNGSQCTLSGAIGNVDSFLNGNFSDGGWTRWFEIVSEPQNNIYGATAIAESRMYASIRQEQENKERESDWSNGWLSIKDCSSGKCITVTPGNVISEYLNFNLTVGQRTLIEADEINELVGAVFAQLGQQAISGVGGLLGMSYSPDGVTPSYLSQLEFEEQTTGFQGGAGFLEEAITTEEDYQNIYTSASDDLNDAEDDLLALSCTQANAILSDIEDQLDLYAVEIESVGGVMEILQLLLQTYNATVEENIKLVIVDEFQRMQREGLLHSASEVATVSFEVAEEVVDLEGRANRAASSCN